ncbi:hypothetical protein [Phreatobacter sp.]|uniref:hypothetical protein n=1 Tax=Phreatobacter sp. TaxID=1966341 RepID=UPI003F7082F8
MVRPACLVAVLGLLTAAGLPATVALAQPSLPACSLGEADWRQDRTFLESRHPAIRHQPVAPLACRTVEVVTEPVGTDRLRVLRARVFETRGDGEGIQQGVNLIVLSRLAGDAEKVLGRFLVPYDVSRDAPAFFPTVQAVGDAIVVHLGDSVATAYRIAGDRVVPFDSHAWAASAFPAAGPGWVPGRVRKVNFASMEGFVSLYRAGSDDPATPGSAYDGGGRVVRAALAFDGDRLVARGAAVVDHGVLQDVEETVEIVEAQEAADLARRRLPAGTEPCMLSAWSVDPDPSGLNVRAGPSPRSRVLGRVPPAWTTPGRDGEPGETYRAEFEIVGYRDGWFLIRGIKAPGVDYGERYPRSRPQPYRGQGWVAARLVGAALANGGLPAGNLYQAPNRHSASREVRRADGERISTGDIVQALHACSGRWGLIGIEGARGWWNGLCSNQVTNCS